MIENHVQRRIDIYVCSQHKSMGKNRLIVSKLSLTTPLYFYSNPCLAYLLARLMAAAAAAAATTS
jgi:hypothetical protein